MCWLYLWFVLVISLNITLTILQHLNLWKECLPNLRESNRWHSNSSSIRKNARLSTDIISLVRDITNAWPNNNALPQPIIDCSTYTLPSVLTVASGSRLRHNSIRACINRSVRAHDSKCKHCYNADATAEHVLLHCPAIQTHRIHITYLWERSEESVGFLSDISIIYSSYNICHKKWSKDREPYNIQAGTRLSDSIQSSKQRPAYLYSFLHIRFFNTLHKTFQMHWHSFFPSHTRSAPHLLNYRSHKSQ